MEDPVNMQDDRAKKDSEGIMLRNSHFCFSMIPRQRIRDYQVLLQAESCLETVIYGLKFQPSY